MRASGRGAAARAAARRLGPVGHDAADCRPGAYIVAACGEGTVGDLAKTKTPTRTHPVAEFFVVARIQDARDKSSIDETFENSLLEYPQFTKPKIWEGKSVPDVLFSGDHAKIKSWRLSQSEAITRRQRPDLWEKYKKEKKQ